MIEGLVAPVTHDFGHVLGGPSVLARLDICDPAKTVVPYFQVGTGFVLNDGFKDSNQRAIGQCFEFLQQVEVGVRWKLNSNISVLAEGGWQHISNADLARRNLGANNLGGSIGLRWSFGGR
jgi:lipid A 3-O-deacylase